MLKGDMTVNELITKLNMEMLDLYNNFCDGLPYTLSVFSRANEIVGIERKDNIEFCNTWDILEPVNKNIEEEEIDLSAVSGIKRMEILLLSDYTHEYLITLGQIKYKKKRVILKTGVAEIEHWVQHHIDCNVPKKYCERNLVYNKFGSNIDIMGLTVGQLKDIIVESKKNKLSFKPKIT